MKEIFVYSRYAAEAMQPHEEPHIIVSINCPGDPPARIKQTRAQLGRVNLFVWDIDQKVPGVEFLWEGKLHKMEEIPEEELFQPAHAKAIIDLVEAHPEAEHIIVHCTAGKSRSAGVAAALHKVLNGSDEPIFGNARYRPNMRVYRMVLEEWYSRHPME